jgi:hypothetical protein
MPRGFEWAYYESDDGHTYAFHVDQEYFPMPERGWTGPAIHGTPVYPRGWVPRRVFGVGADGSTRFAYVGSTSADLWTGAATTFTIIGNDGLTHTYTVFKSRAEIFRQKP